ncbi:unnamed protein product [Mesocestoides corti]|uniref:Uncharacterized protein n=1 Tax=Mesocestoides corti TaxID=53468 RepID=A0A0R3U7J9_MESCO|nr:unnamed protein product [Mesocestoides corti]
MSASDVKTAPKSQEEQELEFKAKYPRLAQKGASSMLLQKRLNRGVTLPLAVVEIHFASISGACFGCVGNTSSLLPTPHSRSMALMRVLFFFHFNDAPLTGCVPCPFQHKFFDSGDYNMARAKTARQKCTSVDESKATEAEQEEMLQESTGVTIATPESVPAVRKKSMAEALRSPRGSIVATAAATASTTTTTAEPQHSTEH